jgi:hypothetical protein
MSPSRSRQFTSVLVAFAFAAGSFFVAGSAQADTALFRVQQSWHNFPNPAVTTPGGAGKYEAYVQPYMTLTGMGGYLYPPGTAIVEPGNPVGGAFTLPTGFYSYVGKFSITPKTGWPGYTTFTYVDAYNGPGKFGPNNPNGATAPARIVFPTTGGNPAPNYGLGNPLVPTTTFGGVYDISRIGSINVEPGPRRFGGTMRLFYGPTAGFYQYVYYFQPAYYKQYGYYHCFNNANTGMKFDCTKDTFVSEVSATTAIYQIRAFLLNVQGTGTGMQVQDNTAKATTPIGYGGYLTPYSNASFVTRFQRYINLIHPWTTGFASVQNPVGSPNIITPQKQGGDVSLGGADITVTRTDWDQNFITTPGPDGGYFTTTTTTSKNYLKSVGRVVSLVRPRVIHTYAVPIDPADPVTNTWPVARMWTMDVYFVPEAAGMLMLGVGIAALLGVSRMRRR